MKLTSIMHEVDTLAIIILHGNFKVLCNVGQFVVSHFPCKLNYSAWALAKILGADRNLGAGKILGAALGDKCKSREVEQFREV